MSISDKTLDGIFEQVLSCYRSGEMVQPFSNKDLSDADAYRVQYRLVEHLRKQGQIVAGRKVGPTRRSAMIQMGLEEPGFGHILDQGVYPNDSNVPVGDFADAHAEAEVAFLLGQDLPGPGVTALHVISATQAVLPAFELVDIKVQEEGLRGTDLIAHNTFHGGVVIGSRLTHLEDVDLQFEGVTVQFNGDLAGTATASEVMGNPINAVVWLANKLAEFDDHLRAGEIIMTGSIVSPSRVRPGDHFNATYTRLGTVGARFV